MVVAAILVVAQGSMCYFIYLQEKLDSKKLLILVLEKKTKDAPLPQFVQKHNAQQCRA